MNNYPHKNHSIHIHCLCSENLTLKHYKFHSLTSCVGTDKHARQVNYGAVEKLIASDGYILLAEDVARLSALQNNDVSVKQQHVNVYELLRINLPHECAIVKQSPLSQVDHLYTY